MDEDERVLRELQERLAHAWVEKDRAYIESVLAPEWKVTQADGSVLSRAEVMNLAFETSSLTVTRLVVADVSVQLFDEVAIVRGRTEAAGVLNGVTTTARIRFTDTLMKRDGRWCAVASHASPAAS